MASPGTSFDVGKNELPMFIVDAFTDRPFTGNPAAVCLVDANQELSDEKMQKIAAEMNLSETAFLRVIEDGDTFQTGSRFELRWFTPQVEVPLCGHATLASAAVLFRCIGNQSGVVTFDTLYSGQLKAVRDGEFISLDLPNNKPTPLTDDEVNELDDVIKTIIRDWSVQDVQYSPATKKLLVRLSDSYTIQDLQNLKANVDKLPDLHNGSKVRGVIVTVKGSSTAGGLNNLSGQQYDFASRYFAPWVGINEDPVTGSAHTVLGPYWSSVLSKDRLLARQCSVRGGDLLLTLRGNRVDVAGRDVIVLRGAINIAS